MTWGRWTVLSGALLLLGSPARADLNLCRETIVLESARNLSGVLRDVARCEVLVLAGRLPASTNCRAAPGTPPVLALAARARSRIGRQCCGADRACGTADDQTLAAIGWGASVCPDFESSACANPVADPDGIGVCATCVGAAAIDQVREIVYGRVTPAALGTGLSRCQLAIANASTRFVSQRSQLLAKCWAARVLGLHANPCPVPGDGRAGLGITQAEARLLASICRACGGADRQCGGGDDVNPTALGFLSACPALALPGGGSCAAPILGMADVVTCITCVTGLATDCADRLTVPAFAAYPGECNPPRGTCTPGVPCETSLDCPGGYTCSNNGGGARYCVGPSCTGDPDCGGGGVCRQYCTLAGCGAPRCQCPGFSCPAADQLCIEDGGLACRKICTQDSDCVDPFGLVCVNPGFGFGVCIGNTPCQ